jgi:hypothetical protein
VTGPGHLEPDEALGQPLVGDREALRARTGEDPDSRPRLRFAVAIDPNVGTHLGIAGLLLALHGPVRDLVALARPIRIDHHFLGNIAILSQTERGQ